MNNADPTFVTVFQAFVAIALGAAILLVAIRWGWPSNKHQVPQEYINKPPIHTPVSKLPYVRKKYLLTKAELVFFAVLRDAAPPGWHVFPQVRLATLIETRTRERSHFNRIAAKCVDFVLCEPQALSPQLVVELDDSSHARQDRKARDAFVDEALASAGLPILHVRWQRSYDAQLLTAQIRIQLGLAHEQLPQAPTPAQAPLSDTAENAWMRPIASASPLSLPATPRENFQQLPPATMTTAKAGGVLDDRTCPECHAPVSQLAKLCRNCGRAIPPVESLS